MENVETFTQYLAHHAINIIVIVALATVVCWACCYALERLTSNNDK